MSSYPQPHQATPTRQPGPVPQRNTAGRVSLILGLILVGLSLVQQFLAYLLPFMMAGDRVAFSTQALLNVVASTLLFLLSLVTVIVAIVGLTGPPRPRGAAGVGLGIGGSMLLSVVTGAAFASATGAWFG